MAFDNLIRKSTASGSFYPADPDALKKQIDGFMDNVEPLGLHNIKAIIMNIAFKKIKEDNGEDYKIDIKSFKYDDKDVIWRLSVEQKEV